MNQTKIDSFMEQLVNTGIGLLAAFIMWEFVVLALIEREIIVVDQTLIITSMFTIVSLVRGYLVRRLFNGKQPWTVIKSYLVA